MSPRLVRCAWGLIVVLAGCTSATAPATPLPATPLPATATPAATAPATPLPSAPAASAPPSQTALATPTMTATATATPSPTSIPPTPPAPPEWQELGSAGGPGAREDHTWTVSGDGASAYLFGGRAGQREFNDLWRYDLAADSWLQLEPDGEPPAARFGHTAVWVAGVGLVVWSGQTGPRFFSDIWGYDPQADSWVELPSDGDLPPARYGSCAAMGPDGRMWISHGFTEDTGRFADTRAYDFQAGSWTDLTVAGSRPVERCLHDCLWTPDGRFVVYAGQTTGAPAIGDLWSFDEQSGAWTQAPMPEPQPRQLYALAQLGGQAYVFGGGASDGRALNDLWRLDLAGLGWSAVGAAGETPPGRFAATLIADEPRGRLLLFGGKRGNAELRDVWQLALTP